MYQKTLKCLIDVLMPPKGSQDIGGAQMPPSHMTWGTYGIEEHTDVGGTWDIQTYGGV